MLTLDTTGAPLLRITVTGEITREGIRDFYKEFEAALDRYDRVGLLIDMRGFTDIGAGALLEDILGELKLLDDLHRMPRAAVVTGNRTIAGLIGYVAPLVPRMHMRAFTPDAMEEAEAWAGDLPPPRKERPGLRRIESGSDDVLAFELDGYLDDDQMDEIVRPFRARLDRGGRFNALVRLKHFGGFDPEILFDRSLIGMKWDAVRALNRYAVVTDATWVRPFVGFAKLVSNVDIRIFPMAEEAAAWDWVREPPVVSA
ncbi:MAG: SpoIIAA family protein [Pseudooceanicola sp.]